MYSQHASGARPNWATVALAAMILLMALGSTKLYARVRTGQIPVNISINPNPVTSGNTATITVTLSGTVSSNQVVSTSYSVDGTGNGLGLGDPVALSNFPSSITVLSGHTSASFVVGTSGTGTATVTAACNSGSTSGTITVQ